MSLHAEARSTAESAAATLALHIDAAFDAVFAPTAPDASPRLRLGESIVRLRPKHAQDVRDVRVRWSLHGAADAPLVIVQGGISADRHVAARGDGPGWWGGIVGDGAAIDLRCRRVLSIDWLARGELGDVSAVTSDDQADAIAAVLDELGERRAHACVGASYGAMVGLAFAARHPHRLDRLVAIAGAHRAHPLSIAVRNIQREIVRLAARHGDVAAGLDLARRLAMTTYRGEREFAERCAAPPRQADGRFRFAEEDWLAAAGARFAQRFDAERFLALSESIDLHAVAPEQVRVPTTLVGIASDRVVPLADLCDLQRRCGAAATLHVIDSRYGHDAFLKEPAQIGALLHEALGA
ncbi:homoserine O-succinyltransferase MetX [Dokdonella fugitiva]|jgi:homoserine O-acetyltransferase|uniref:Homoserine O-acetyltransferase n=1 Tax=Dokdonella fugitiva TaxID=328517 RepID=A0A4R2I1Q8_9GAMM|nr:homoserine O-succinyltransferase [Dokdonella fugitiva]MBA8885563.1 homoserine O-acetyltransferase [Dokdonella fugitiva]TCO36868.1 homoserine O-acetyltransferase [Dokdonella fugitiva]